MIGKREAKGFGWMWVVSVLPWVVLLIPGLLLSFDETSWARSGQDPASLLQKADACRKALEVSWKKKKYRHHWLKCIGVYQKVYSNYPESEEAPWALYRAARLYMKLYAYSIRPQDLDEALALFDRLTKTYKDHRLADDAQYMIGEIYYRYKKDPSRAYLEFLKAEVRYPGGDRLPRVKQRLDTLARLLGKGGELRAKYEPLERKKSRARVQDIRHWSTRTYTRVVIDVNAPVQYEHHQLPGDPASGRPLRLYLDLHGARLARRLPRAVAIEGELLQRARVGQFSPDVVRVVLDVNSIGSYEVFNLYDPFRIVVDARAPEGARLKEEKAGTGTAKDVSLARQLGLTVKRVVIDPGHGGKDPGCTIGPGIQEKDITLALAKVLAQEIRRKLGCQVFLTREKDVFLSLEQRTAIANMRRADLFISIHCNAHEDPKVHGVETYFLNVTTDQASIRVAARENAASQKSMSELDRILRNLLLNTKIQESSRLAHDVQQRMVGVLSKAYPNIHDLGVKQAPFYVLIGAEMPSVLVEGGFLSNPLERKRLKDLSYQKRLAGGICEGLLAYVEGMRRLYSYQPGQGASPR